MEQFKHGKPHIAYIKRIWTRPYNCAGYTQLSKVFKRCRAEIEKACLKVVTTNSRECTTDMSFPALWEAWDVIMRNNKNRKMRLANNTWAMRGINDSVIIRLHRTDIITYRRDGITEIACEDWPSQTTADRILRFGPCGANKSETQLYLTPPTFLISGFELCNRTLGVYNVVANDLHLPQQHYPVDVLLSQWETCHFDRRYYDGLEPYKAQQFLLRNGHEPRTKGYIVPFPMEIESWTNEWEDVP